MNTSKQRALLVSLMLALALVLSACPQDQPPGGAVVEDPLQEDPVIVEEEPVEEEPVVDDPAATPTEDPALATETPEAVAEETPGTEAVAGEFGVAGIEQGTMLASTLLNTSVDNFQGEDLGAVEDALIDLQTGDILFVTVSHGGFLGIGDDEIMVPLSAMSWDTADEEFVIDVDDDAFSQWPTVEGDTIDLTDPAWDDQVTAFWQDAGVNVFWDPTTEMNTVTWVSNLINTGLDFGTDAGTGNIDDVVIDLAESRATYALFAFDTGLFEDDAWRAIPFSAMNVTRLDTGELLIEPAIEAETLTTAPAVQRDAFGDVTLFDATWDDDINTFWETEGFGVTSERAAVTDAPVQTEEAAVSSLGLTGVEDDIMIQASALLNREVEDPNRERLGFVEDFLVDLQTGNVLFTIVEHGGFLGIGTDTVPVPLEAMGLSPDNDELILNVPEEQFETFPDIDIDATWPTGLEATWDDELLGFWSNAGFARDTEMIEAVDSNLVMRASALVGYGVGYTAAPGGATATGAAAPVATADDFLVDLGEGRVKYALLSFVDVNAFGSDWIIVPFEAYDPLGFGDQFTLREGVDTDVIANAPVIQRTAFDDAIVVPSDWDNEVEAFWQEQGFFQE